MVFLNKRKNVMDEKKKKFFLFQMFKYKLNCTFFKKWTLPITNHWESKVRAKKNGRLQWKFSKHSGETNTCCFEGA